jgi:hypothetical protein
MALSKEFQYYHLTTKGWVDGSFKGDVLGGTYEKKIPANRVLTILFIDEIPAPFSKPIYRTQVEWQSDDIKIIKKLKAKFGDLPSYVQEMLSKH